MILPGSLSYVPFEVWYKRCQVYVDERPKDILRHKIKAEVSLNGEIMNFKKVLIP